MTSTRLQTQPGPGGARVGAGRKAGGQNRDSDDRKQLSAWLCSWFSQSLTASQKRLASDADCEQAVNGCFEKPVFESEKITLGGSWAQARRGERPFSAARLAIVVTAADRLEFWDPRWRRDLAKVSGESDHLSLVLLSLIAVEGIDGQKSEKYEFTRRQMSLQKAVDRLAASTLPQFEKRRLAALADLHGWFDFVSDLSAGHVGVRRDLAASIEGGIDTERRWRLKPAQTIRRLSNLKFESKHDALLKVTWQVWALDYRAANFSESAMLLNHLRKRKTGTKLSQ